MAKTYDVTPDNQHLHPTLHFPVFVFCETLIAGSAFKNLLNSFFQHITAPPITARQCQQG